MLIKDYFPGSWAILFTFVDNWYYSKSNFANYKFMSSQNSLHAIEEAHAFTTNYKNISRLSVREQ